MMWRITSDEVQPDPEPGEEGVGWLWPIESRTGAQKAVLVRVSADALERDASEETESAKATKGRSIVERFLDDDNPPGRIELDAGGIARRDEQVDETDRPSSASPPQAPI